MYFGTAGAGTLLRKQTKENVMTDPDALDALLAKSQQIGAEIKSLVARFESMQSQQLADLAARGLSPADLRAALEREIPPNTRARLDAIARDEFEKIRREINAAALQQKEAETSVTRRPRPRLPRIHL
jgi:hypothetical protein